MFLELQNKHIGIDFWRVFNINSNISVETMILFQVQKNSNYLKSLYMCLLFIIHVLTTDQFHVSLLNKSINLFLNKFYWPQTFNWYCIHKVYYSIWFVFCFSIKLSEDDLAKYTFKIQKPNPFKEIEALKQIFREYDHLQISISLTFLHICAHYHLTFVNTGESADCIVVS